MTKLEKNRIAVVGLGYVGLPLALLASRKGYEVYGIDNSVEKIEKLKNKVSPFLDEKVTEEIKTTKLNVTSDFTIIEKCNITIVCVPTPIDENKTPDLIPLENACRNISPYIKKGASVIIESTINPGVCENIVIPIIESGSKLKAGVDFHVSHCPERINPGDKKWTVENINRVIGSLEARGLEIAYKFYSSIINADIHKMGNLKEAEAVKIVENSFRDINIAFVNELAMSFNKLGIDVLNVIKGASTKQFSFMPHYPGCGVGGHCIPVDPYYLIKYAKENGFNHAFLSLAREINNDMPVFTVNLLTKLLKENGTLPEKVKVTILGISYKADIDDFRESPAFNIIEEAKKQGYIVSAFDPYVLHKSTDQNMEDALKDSNAVIIATNHQEFTKLKPSFFTKRHISFIVDGRNCLNKKTYVKSGIKYVGIGT